MNAWERIRTAFIESAGLTQCNRELSKEEISKNFAYENSAMRTMDLLLKANRPLASFSVARHVVEQPEVSKPVLLRALHLTAYAVAEHGGVPESAKDIIEKLRAKADTMQSDVMQPLLRRLFDSMSENPSRGVADGAVPAMGAAAKDLYAIQACAALRRRDLDDYRKLSAGESQPIHVDRALYETASRVARKDAKAARQILDEYLGRFSRREQPIANGDFEQFTKPFLGLRPEWRLKPAEPVGGTCSSCGEKLEPTRPMPQRQFESLKREVENVVFNKAALQRAGSSNELERLRKYAEIEREMKPKKLNMIVIDFLNVRYAQRNFSEPRFWSLITRLKEDFNGIYTVGRPFGIYVDEAFSQKLKEQGVERIFCEHSTSDLNALCLAMWLGADTKLLSNDHFEDLKTKLPASVHHQFDAWYQRNVIGFSPLDLRYSVPPSFSRAVDSSSSGYHVWTVTERDSHKPSMLTQYKLYCLQSGQPT